MPPTPTVRHLRRDLTVVATLTRTRDIKGQKQLNEPGQGNLTMQNDDPQLAAIGDDDIIQYLLDGTVVFAWTVRRRERTTLDTREASAQATVLSGPGVLALLDEALVYPSRAPAS